MTKKVSPKTKTKTAPKKSKGASKKSLVKTRTDKKARGKKVVGKAASKKIVKIKKEKENYLARWTTPAFVCGEGEIWMYRISLVASAAMSVWSFYKQDLMVGITFGLLALVVAKYLFQKPADIECRIDLDGVRTSPLKRLRKAAGKLLEKCYLTKREKSFIPLTMLNRLK